MPEICKEMKIEVNLRKTSKTVFVTKKNSKYMNNLKNVLTENKISEDSNLNATTKASFGNNYDGNFL